MSSKEIKLDPKNYRVHNDRNKRVIRKSLEDCGAGRSVLIDKDNILIAGNGVYEQAKELGIPIRIIETDGKELVVVKRNDLKSDDEKRKLLALADNHASDTSMFDFDLVAQEFNESVLSDYEFEFPEPVMEDDVEAKEDDFDVPEGGIETDIVLGDLFEIGEHRLLCGDSTDSDSVAKLMNGEKADMVFTDPPYGISVVNTNSKKVGGDGETKFGKVGGRKIVEAKVYSEIIGDDTTDTAREFYNTCIALGMENFIIWGGNYFTDFLKPSMCWIIWDKENTGNFADVEMAWTSFDKGAKLYKWLWNGMSRKGSREVEGKTRVHPTQKPVGLFGDIFNDFIFKVCFDGFLGSGSTMVAAHQLKRKCYGMELDPKYCQVIVNRMIKLDPTIEIKKNGQKYSPQS